MTIEAWPFLVGRNKALGYQTIVCPQFLSEAGLAQLLAEAVGGDDSDLDAATYREILGSPVGDIGLVFRVVKAKAQDYGLGGDKVLLDRSGRSIHLIEGFVIQGRNGTPPVTLNDFQMIHGIVKDGYRDFWQAQATFQEIVSLPIELPVGSQGFQQLQLIEEAPMDLRSRSRKAIELFTHLVRAGTTSQTRNQESRQRLIEVGPPVHPNQGRLQQRRWLLVLLLTLFIAYVVITLPRVISSSPPASSNCTGGAIAIGGSTALQPLVSKAAESYHTMCPQANISTNQGVTSSQAGLSEVESGNIQIGASDLISSRADLVDHPVAVAIYVLILNRDVSAVTNLTISQIQHIYNGSVTNWDQVGGPNLPISVVSRTSTSGTRRAFEQYILKGPETLPLGPKHVEVGTADIVASKVASTSGAIGYVDLGTATNQNLSTVSIDGINGSSPSVQSGRYPFWTVEHMYTKGNPSGLTKAFLDYMLGDQVAGMVKDLSYLSFNAMPSEVLNAHPGTIAPGEL